MIFLDTDHLTVLANPRAIISWGIATADALDALQKQKIRVGSQDLKIAAMTLVHDALLLSANLRDYRKVPGLRVENRLEIS